MDDDEEQFGAKRSLAEALRLAEIVRGTGIGRIGEIARRLPPGSTIASMTAGSTLQELMKKVRPLDFALEASTARQISKIIHPHGEAIRMLEGKHGALSIADRLSLSAYPSSFAKLGLPNWASVREASEIGSVGRALRWAEHANSGAFSSLIAKQSVLASMESELAAITRSASHLQSLSIGRTIGAVSIGDAIARHSAFDQTLLKMSMLAGAIDTAGSRSAVSNAAFGSLMGGWRTRPDLPLEYWQRPSVRRDFYRDADVDTGLIDARNTEIVEVLIESGVVEGEVRGSTVTAVVEAGPLSVRISTSRPRVGAYRVITGFEIAMRGLVAQVLETAHRNEDKDPASWFKQRAPGDVLRRARERRAEALKAGEPDAPFISFVDLGDLIAIVVFGQNWPHFEPIFGSKEGFSVDMQRLNALRRPTMHARAIDGVQLTEMVLTISRMTNMIKRSCGWNSAWEDEG